MSASDSSHEEFLPFNPSPCLVDRLPNELLSYIFLTLAELVLPDNYCWLRASHICKRWRNVALGTPLLWALVNLSNHDRVVEFIKRSRSVPLRLVGKFNASTPRQTWQLLEDVINTNAARLVSLTLAKFPPPGYREGGRNLLTYIRISPLLCNLTQLDLKGRSLSPPTGTGHMDDFTMDHLLEILGNNPRLEYLRLVRTGSIILPSDVVSALRPRKAKLLHLRTLTLGYDPWEVQAILGHLLIPACKQYRLETFADEYDEDQSDYTLTSLLPEDFGREAVLDTLDRLRVVYYTNPSTYVEGSSPSGAHAQFYLGYLNEPAHRAVVTQLPNVFLNGTSIRTLEIDHNFRQFEQTGFLLFTHFQQVETLELHRKSIEDGPVELDSFQSIFAALVCAPENGTGVLLPSLQHFLLSGFGFNDRSSQLVQDWLELRSKKGCPRLLGFTITNAFWLGGGAGSLAGWIQSWVKVKSMVECCSGLDG